MKTAIRRPKMHKPSKGQKTYLKQGLKAFKKAIVSAMGPANPNQWFRSAADERTRWLGGYRFTNHNPHQGGQEKARRVRQMAEHKCINPECWT